MLRTRRSRGPPAGRSTGSRLSGSRASAGAETTPRCLRTITHMRPRARARSGATRRRADRSRPACAPRRGRPRTRAERIRAGRALPEHCARALAGRRRAAGLLLMLGKSLLHARKAGDDELVAARDSLAAGDHEAAAEAEVMLATLASFVHGDRDRAFRHLERAAELVESLPPSPAKAYVLASFANWLRARRRARAGGCRGTARAGDRRGAGAGRDQGAFAQHDRVARSSPRAGGGSREPRAVDRDRGVDQLSEPRSGLRQPCRCAHRPRRPAARVRGARGGSPRRRAIRSRPRDQLAPRRVTGVRGLVLRALGRRTRACRRDRARGTGSLPRRSGPGSRRHPRRTR